MAKAKSLKTNSSMPAPGATHLLPGSGDFRLGSAESRAAARAMLQPRRVLGPYDKDCYTLFLCTGCLGGAWPDYKWLESKSVYEHGKEVFGRVHGPIVHCSGSPQSGVVSVTYSRGIARENAPM